jgi:hypothetical protein
MVRNCIRVEQCHVQSWVSGNDPNMSQLLYWSRIKTNKLTVLFIEISRSNVTRNSLTIFAHMFLGYHSIDLKLKRELTL